MNHRELLNLPIDTLWTLFPITLVAHSEHWAQWYEEEKQQLETLLADQAVAIHHIGSTAIPGIRAKPIIDILVETVDLDALHQAATILDDNGYLPMNGRDTRITFNKGYTLQGYAERVFHIHLHLLYDRDEVHFRDQLLAQPELARAYENLKIELLQQHPHNRDAYTRGKTAFVNKIINKTE